MGLALRALNQLITDLSYGDIKPPAPPIAPPAAAPEPPPPPPPVPTAAKPAVAKAKAAAAPQAKKQAAKAAEEGTPPPTSAAPPAPAPSGGGTLPPTEALYQTDTYLFTCEAKVLAVEPLLNDAGWVVLLDRTCFHPQGGGQPADSGTITAVDGGAAFAVSACKKDPSGVVRHEGSEAAPAFAAGASVTCVVDEGPRVKNARVHSAGHLIDVAMTESLKDINVALRPTKGYHFTPGAYVEYDGKLDAAQREAVLPKLQVAMDRLVAEAIPTVVRDVEGQKLDSACPLTALPPDRGMWGTGWVRCVIVGGVGCPCGGTHVRDTAELGKVKVEGIKCKGKVTRVSYSMDLD